MSFTRGESIALWTGVILFVTFLGCVFYRLCAVTCRTMISNMGHSKRKKKLNPMEKRVNKILNNESAREILKAHALTAINSQVRTFNLSQFRSKLCIPGKPEEVRLQLPGESGQCGECPGPDGQGGQGLLRPHRGHQHHRGPAWGVGRDVCGRCE